MEVPEEETLEGMQEGVSGGQSVEGVDWILVAFFFYTSTLLHRPGRLERLRSRLF